MLLPCSIALLSLSLVSAAYAEEPKIGEASPTPAPSAVVAPNAARLVDQISNEEKAKAADLWSRSMDAFNARDFKASAKLLQEYLDKYPGTAESVDARYHLGQSHLFARDPEKAIAPFLAVVEVRGKTDLGNEARTYLGQAYLDASKFTEAYLVSEELLAQAGISSTLRAKALLLRAHAQAGMKQNLEAEKTLVAFQSVAESDPELERETAASYLVSLLLKSNHCDALPSAKSLPEDQIIDQISRKSICVLEMGTYLAKASKRLDEKELSQGADTVAASLKSLRVSCANPPLAAGKRSAAKLAVAKHELSEKLRESCQNAEKLIAEAFRERENLQSLQARILTESTSVPVAASPAPKKSAKNSTSPLNPQLKKSQPQESQ